MSAPSSAAPHDAVHVYPLFGREHLIDKEVECWCHPELDEEDGIVVIVHRVFH